MTRASTPIAIVLGTRAELIKMAPVMHALARKKVAYVYVHTGQHKVTDLAQELKVRVPDVVIEPPERAGPSRGRFSSLLQAIAWNARVFLRVRHTIARLRPRIVLIHGDTMTTATVALAVRTLSPRPLLAHVEAGLRSHDVLEPFPEEISRRIADACSDILFAPTSLASQTFSSFLYAGKSVHVVGNTNVDVLLSNLPHAKRVRVPWMPRKPFLFSQMHRHENITNRRRAQALVEVLTRAPCPVVFVLLENTRKQLQKFGLLDSLKSAKNVRLVDNLPYLHFLKVFSSSSCVLADSGGQTEEASVLGIPTIVFRKRNERMEAEHAGTAIRTLDPHHARALITEVLSKGAFYRKARAARNPFGDGRAGKRMAQALLSILSDNT